MMEESIHETLHDNMLNRVELGKKGMGFNSEYCI